MKYKDIAEIYEIWLETSNEQRKILKSIVPGFVKVIEEIDRMLAQNANI